MDFDGLKRDNVVVNGGRRNSCPRERKIPLLFTKRGIGKESNDRLQNFPKMAWIHANFPSNSKRQKWNTKSDHNCHSPPRKFLSEKIKIPEPFIQAGNR
ncbi:hypothetical protein Zmor_014150 [Zophobas morio]|uniref:Uncharacterized protein n=1 Tax=Zophobas morio TaxID=2755281 RepID=A0AA38IJ57_9CUCU|nr:hypothetical protein Zmor_014150 [Zophobas morio]